ncbi:GNAT family N-acetyltransferase [Noviherbaspirillum galbum]|uniref:GNAT family N-acetyltransferase n=1 Tax=Noviherbaspirillum galbum TaxID=2709383 RepID=A0A6B3SRY1_9BURK|nr:GNAT family N-acetyltransferase [Noviherbaspirillum galbum]NEX63517.1 GNAT family N-acetyltransferase [Noviherbaspirillum galbum]
MENQAIKVTWHSGALPDPAIGMLDQLYAHLHSSAAYYSVYGVLATDTHACVLESDGKTVAVFLFRHEGKRILVVNEQCAFPPAAVDAFAEQAFDRHPDVEMIAFTAILSAATKRFPSVSAKRTQDIVLTLPASEEQYLAQMGKSTRAYIKRYLNKLKRCHPTVSWVTYERGEVPRDQLLAVIELNRARMASRFKTSYIDDAETDRIMSLVERCGLVTIMTIDGKVCAGTINYRVADNYFLQVIAHDPAYDEHGLGTLCCYLTACECIRRKGREYHFLWGRYEYKYRLLGVQHDLSDVLIFRSSLHRLRHADTVIRFGINGKLYEIKDWAEAHARRQDNSSFAGRAVHTAMNSLKKLKRGADRIRMRSDAHGVLADVPVRHSPPNVS